MGKLALVALMLAADTSVSFAQGHLGTPRSRRAAPAMPRASAESSWATTWPCNSAFSRTGAGSVRLAGKFSRAMACRGKPLHRSSAHSPCETGISSDRLTVHAARLVCGRPKMRVRSRPRWSRK